jgi:hypothetical protein
METKYSYILLSSMPYESTWVLGVVNSLDQALSYFNETVKQRKLSDIKMSDQELVQRALDDNWGDYFDYWVEVWDNMQRVCTYKYNTKTNELNKYKKFGDKGQVMKVI